MDRREASWLGGATLVAAVLRLAGIAGQIPTLDDEFVLVTARDYVLSGHPFPTMPFHPNLRNILVFASSELAGAGVLGLKGWSLVLGILAVPLLGVLVYRLTRSRTASIVAALLLALDGVHVDFSRQAIQEVHAGFFVLLGAYLVVEALLTDDGRRWRWLLPLAGVAFGAGAASKLYALPVLAASIALLVIVSARRRRWDDAGFAVASLTLVPFAVFFVTYLPWFGRGYSIGEWVTYQRAVVEAMLRHSKPTVGFLAYNEPWQWFLRPFMGEVDVVARAATSPQVAVAVGNPLAWLAVLPAAAYSLILHRRRRADVVLQSFFWAGYLPLALSPRPIWILSSVAIIPFAFGLVGMAAADLLPRLGRRVVWGYVAACVVGSLLLYPLAIGRSLDYAYLSPVVSLMGDYRAALQAPSR
ncbi:MAG TPA: phospholipid carrier-dependent glycosyltransferase [Coriobacteriia bacterium]